MWSTEGNTSDNEFLSKVNDDTAAGAITFEGKTTHEGGVSVTGGDPADVVAGLYSVGESEVSLASYGTRRLTAQKNIAIYTDPTATDGTYRQLSMVGDMPAASTNRRALSITTNFPAGTGNQDGIFLDMDTSATGGTHRGVVVSNKFASEGNTSAFWTNIQAGTNNFAINSTGSAPSYFAGDIIQGNDDNDGIFAGTVSGVIIRNGSQTISRPAVNGASASFVNFRADSTVGSIKRTNAGDIVTQNITVTTRASRTATVPADLLDGSSVIKLLTPSTEGFAAQDLIDNVPSAVIEDEPENDEVSIDQTKLIPLLTKALQEALNRIEELESNTLQPLYSTFADLPSASDHHGKTAHVHDEGALYFAHAGNWVKLQNA